MIKYGEKDHLEQIINGKIRFAPSQGYIKLEEAQHSKGQGDLLEGKMKIKIQGAKLFHPETGAFLGVLPPNSIIIVSIQDVNNMPVFCLSQYGDEYIAEYINEQNFSISLPAAKLNSIKSDFPKATHALVICETDKFIRDINDIGGHEFVHGGIRYYDYDINPMQMYMYLCSGCEDIQTNTPMPMTYENRYRHLLCKDIAFSIQDEYRFIELNDLIANPVFYPLKFTSKYQIIPIEQLVNPLPIRI